jgi:hypothetical protein
MTDEFLNPKAALYRLSEILEPIAVRDDYGHWHLDRDAQTLTLSADSPARYEYVINLAELNTSGEMLDLIMQVANKTWATAEMLGTLVEALNDIFEPQVNLCSWGEQRTIRNPDKFLKKRLVVR